MSHNSRFPMLALCSVFLGVLHTSPRVAAQPTVAPVPKADSPSKQGETSLKTPAVKKGAPTCSRPKGEVSDCFAEQLVGGVLHNKWYGIPTLQNPLDAWVTQEIISEVKPDFIVETGTLMGGSAALWATILEQINPKGRVITIDLIDASKSFRETVPILKRSVDFLHGSSTAAEIVAEVKRRVSGGSVMVILDSAHTKGHVLDELRLYSPLVRVGGYIIAQDGFFDGKQPAAFGPGAYAAVQAFLGETDAFVADRDRERLMGTFNPSGFLRRVK